MASLTTLDLQTETWIVQGCPKPTTIDLVGGILCHICRSIFANKKDFDAHYVLHKTDNKDIVYTCVVCSKQIVGYPSFRGHCYTSHVIKERFKCQHCYKLFSKGTALNDHVNVMHRFRCTHCSKEFTSKKELQLHQIIHNNSDMPPFDCQSCKMKIDTVDGCREHIDKHSFFIYSCPICNENISSIENATDHLQTHFGEITDDSTIDTEKNSVKDESTVEKLGGILCGICSLAFKNRVEFDAHFSCMHGHEDIVYTCVVCGKQFEKYSVFNGHAYNHFVKDRFECDICSKTFTRLSLLVTHMTACQMDAKATGKPFECVQCHRRYSNEKRLREHLREVHDISQLKCPQEGCPKTFKNPKDLLFHQQNHQTQSQWCGQCGLFFTSLHSCERHLDVHKKKLYICPICNRNYSEKHLIMKHVSQHFETVLHLCKVCGKIYNAKNRLVQHMKTHSETKTHGCKYCGKTFTRISHLQQHLNVHTASKPYKCPVCPKAFSCYPNWYKHLQRMHNADSKKYKHSFENSMKGVIFADEHDDDEEILEPIDNTNENNEEIETEIDTDSNETVNNNEKAPEIVDNVDKLSNEKLECFTFLETDGNPIESDIDQIIIEKELEIFENVEPKENMDAFGSVLPENNMLVNDVPLGADLLPTPQIVGFPPEYGPEFNTGLETGCGFIDLDDHNLPHIDPLLTIKIEEHNKMYVDSPNYHEPSNIQFNDYGHTSKWEPPIITKVHHDYTYNYGDMAEANRLILLNSDNFEVFT